MINPKSARYIKLGNSGRKLGNNGSFEEFCINHGYIYMGFGTEKFRDDLIQKKYENFQKSIEGSIKRQNEVTRHLNEVKAFFEDDGSTVWITFANKKMYWAISNGEKPIRFENHDGCVLLASEGWNSNNVAGETLGVNTLAGSLTQLAAYRGTSCSIKDEFEYVVRKINNQELEVTKLAKESMIDFEQRLLPLIQKLLPYDFELLVDLIFSSSGWRRDMRVGGTESIIDLSMKLPSTGEMACVQVKSKFKKTEFDEFALGAKRLTYDRKFFVCHTGEVVGILNDNAMTVLDGRAIAKLAINAGLAQWVIDKVQ